MSNANPVYDVPEDREALHQADLANRQIALENRPGNVDVRAGGLPLTLSTWNLLETDGAAQVGAYRIERFVTNSDDVASNGADPEYGYTVKLGDVEAGDETADLLREALGKGPVLRAPLSGVPDYLPYDGRTLQNPWLVQVGTMRDFERTGVLRDGIYTYVINPDGTLSVFGEDPDQDITNQIMGGYDFRTDARGREEYLGEHHRDAGVIKKILFLREYSRYVQDQASKQGGSIDQQLRRGPDSGTQVENN